MNRLRLKPRGGIEKLNKEKDKTELDQFFLSIEEYRSSKKFKELIDFIAKLPGIAPFNAFLLFTQNPKTSCLVAKKEHWEKKYDRKINKDARPLVILKPFGPVSFVFDVKDTSGEKLPEDLLKNVDTTGTIKFDKEQIEQNLLYDSVTYTEKALNEINYGNIKKKNPEKILKNIRNKTYIFNINYEITINKQKSKETQFSTLIHELGHYYCGHLGTPKNNKKEKMDKEQWFFKYRNLTELEAEFEAECISWLISKRHNLENPSEMYLANYLGKYEKIPEINIDIIFKVVSYIEKLLKGRKVIRKYIVNKEEQENTRLK